MTNIVIIIAVICAIAYLFLNTAIFGKAPDATNSRIKNSLNYKDDSFQNQSETHVMRKEVSYWQFFKDFYNTPKDATPLAQINTIKTDLKNFNPTEPTIIWFGHSSYILFIDGKKILVDPVFTTASPVPIFGQPFDYSENYTAADFPEIDFILITHDHYDHLDYLSIKELIPKTKHFITFLGVDSHLLSWGAKAEQITTLDWKESVTFNHFQFTGAPARHFSGRKFKRGNTLWGSFILETGKVKIYMGGDSGFDNHFEEIGEKYGPFDLAILECGQYGKNWPNIHMFPEEVILASECLKAKSLLPVHWGKFSLAFHSWTAPIDELMIAAEQKNQEIFTPQIGEPLLFLNKNETKQWWK